MLDGVVNKFIQDGYVVLDDFLTANEVEELRKAGDELIQNIPEESHRAVFSTTDAQQSKDKYFLGSSDKVSYFFEADAVDENGKLLVESKIALNKVGHALHWLNPTFKKHTFSEKVKETCFQLGLVEPVIVQSMYIFKNPGVGSEVIPHQDATFLHTDPVKLVGFWIALEDATLENGCLWFAPGSHKSGVHRRFIRNPNPNSEQLLIYDAPAPCYPISNFQPVPVNKGACVLIHGQVVHRSNTNKSGNSRHAYTFHVVDMHGTTYSPDNWLQPSPDQPFPQVYKN
ncbi:Phytanoyl-CoA dioxygenase domain-containing protein 1 [Cryptotermes secundus]|uniref:Phytanoyl-CoA dioxygenase domain-containing protein 1 n=1 Tax=Cryptotermes secundus TaxID=105785 RepID=A0A2J7QTX7_9NEOP|nr:phytanoyl-CoA dioxygenase domain-containing protein 1 [Cryptotermes secundus]PNF32040.1 Phytanoyl-CoA dioxygenase domain-containing protein 1 [Cryptotermes secundus]